MGRLEILALLPELARWLGPVFQAAGYAIVPAAVFLETSVLLGLVAPGDIVLALGGVYAARGELALGWVLAVGSTAAVAGQSGGYWLGRRYGRSVIRALPLVRRIEPRLDDASAFLRRHGGKAVVLGRFATGVSSLVPFSAGTAEMSYPRFATFMVPTAVAWVSAIVAIGYVLGRNLDSIDHVLSGIGWVALGMVLVLTVGAWMWRRRRAGRERS